MEQNQLSPRFIDLSRIGTGQQAEDGVVVYRVNETEGVPKLGERDIRKWAKWGLNGRRGKRD